MSDRIPKLLLDALDAAQAAREFLGEQSLDMYLGDRKTRSAVERQLEILGEACSRIGKLDAQSAAHLPTLKLAIGLRNRIIHGYDGIDHEIVYQTVREDLGPLIEELTRSLPARSNPLR